MAGLMWSSNGSGAGKNSPDERDETVMLYAMSSLSLQSSPDSADRIMLAVATLGSGDVVRMRVPSKMLRHLHVQLTWFRLSGWGRLSCGPRYV
jgi:hypothetical protein